MTTNKFATLRGTIARAKRNDCQKVVMRVTLVEELLLQLSNAEKQVAALAAEVQAVRWAAGQVYSAGYNHGHLNTADELPYASNEELLQRGNEVLIEFTDPDHSGNVTDAVLDEVRASAIPADVMEAIQKVARIRLDLNGFDGDKRGINDCLGEVEESLIEAVNRFAAQLSQERAV